MTALDWFIGVGFGVALAWSLYLLVNALRLKRLYGPADELGGLYRFECTCGWHGYRDCLRPSVSVACPRCNGVAARRRYRSVDAAEL